ncbi:MAG: hypothetical protein ACJAQ0_000308 [Dasania sp.]|jgi:hypothetical protein
MLYINAQTQNIRNPFKKASTILHAMRGEIKLKHKEAIANALGTDREASVKKAMEQKYGKETVNRVVDNMGSQANLSTNPQPLTPYGASADGFLQLNLDDGTVVMHHNTPPASDSSKSDSSHLSYSESTIKQSNRLSDNPKHNLFEEILTNLHEYDNIISQNTLDIIYLAFKEQHEDLSIDTIKEDFQKLLKGINKKTSKIPTSISIPMSDTEPQKVGANHPMLQRIIDRKIQELLEPEYAKDVRFMQKVVANSTLPLDSEHLAMRHQNNEDVIVETVAKLLDNSNDDSISSNSQNTPKTENDHEKLNLFSAFAKRVTENIEPELSSEKEAKLLQDLLQHRQKSFEKISPLIKKEIQKLPQYKDKMRLATMMDLQQNQLGYGPMDTDTLLHELHSTAKEETGLYCITEDTCNAFIEYLNKQLELSQHLTKEQNTQIIDEHQYDKRIRVAISTICVAILDQFSSNKKVGQGIYKNIAAKQLFLDSELKKRTEKSEKTKQAGAVKAAAILNDVRSKNEENTSKESSSVFQTVMAPLQQEQIRNNDNEDLPAAKRPKKA